MIKQTITYTNFNDEEVSVDHYFHMSMKEFMELQNEHAESGGLAEAWFDIIKEGNTFKIMGVFETLIDRSFGVRSEDGEEFHKNDELLKKFKNTPAFEELLFGLMSDVDKALEFFNGIMPSRIKKVIDANEDANNKFAEKLANGEITEDQFRKLVSTKPDVEKIAEDVRAQGNTNVDDIEKLKRELGWK